MVLLVLVNVALVLVNLPLQAIELHTAEYFLVQNQI